MAETKTQPHRLELLAPARNAETALEAIRFGADAVYMGGPAFGARASAGNPVADIARVAEEAHRYNARVYVTLNTIVYESELEKVRDLVWELYDAGADALIVQDMAFLEMSLPPIALHASTQCDIRTPGKAAWLARAGFSQIVLPREFSLEEIREAAEAAGKDTALEVFVHGALCVSYSGDCQAGFAAMGRSANRGECPQMCRLPYDIVDREGNVIIGGKHFLSLKDLRQIENLGALADAGASSFKIEGRLKDTAYVRNVVAAYSRALDALVSASDGRYVRASCGTPAAGFTPDLDKTFNRGYTDYFLRANRPDIASTATPKWIGRPVGTALGACDPRKGFFTIKTSEKLSNGDGLGFFDSHGTFTGFRLNRVDGNRIYPANHIAISAGTQIYRNRDKAFFDAMETASASADKRRIAIDITLRLSPDGRIVAETADERGNFSAITLPCPEVSEARSPQEEYRRNALSRLGTTIYTLRNYTDAIGPLFIPATLLAALKREIVEQLDKAASLRYSPDRRRPCRLTDDAFAFFPPLSYHDNVANSLAERFYTSRGATVSAKAFEVEEPRDPAVVMTTRYCLRRQLGACLRNPATAAKLPRDLYLRHSSTVYSLRFDCAECRMRLIATRLPLAPRGSSQPES